MIQGVSGAGRLRKSLVSKYARKVDANQAPIVMVLRSQGVQVIDMSRVGGGFPDLLAVCAGEIALLEVKSEKGELTDDQLDFIENWRGPPIQILRSAADAVGWVTRTRKRILGV